MALTNDQMTTQIKIIGGHLVEIEDFLRSVAFSQANLYKLLSARVGEFSTPERELLTEVDPIL